MSKHYYIADTHFGHKAALMFDNRPYNDIELMDNLLINNINLTLKDEDHIHFLGDFCYKSQKSPTYYLEKIKGHKHLVIGNHDWQIMESKYLQDYFESIKDVDYIEDAGRKVVLCHYPIASWKDKQHGAYHLYGHIHNEKEDDVITLMQSYKNAFNVGCMLHNYKPVTLDELIQKRKEQNGGLN